MSGMRILVVDDEKDIIDLVGYNLRKEGYEVHHALNGMEAVQTALEILPDLILMDVMMPEMDGMEATSIIRSKPELKDCMIAFLTARAEDYSQIAGFEAGADDYITKPIKPKVLVSKVKGLLRRKDSSESSDIIEVHGLKIDHERFVVTFKGKELQMPKKEFMLLSLLASKPGHVFSRERIFKEIWGDGIVVGDRTIDVHIRKLRSKLSPDLISTIKGVGYKLNES